MTNSTQDKVPFKQIRDDLVFLKNGDIMLILQTTAVNFGLLSENEQIAIIASFAGLLNSLSFSIQIVIRSKRLNISSYLQLLDIQREKQKNPLLSQMILRYRNFIAKTIRENEVLDKKFYVVIGISRIELGISSSQEELLKKAKNLLIPRRDHLIRQLAGIGLQSRQIQTKELIRLFYDIYNGATEQGEVIPEPIPAKEVPAMPHPDMSEYNPIHVVPGYQTPINLPNQNLPPSLQNAGSITFNTPASPLGQGNMPPAAAAPVIPNAPIHQSGNVNDFVSQHLNPNLRTQASSPQTGQSPSIVSGQGTPFVVEELADDYGVF